MKLKQLKKYPIIHSEVESKREKEFNDLFNRANNAINSIALHAKAEKAYQKLKAYPKQPTK